MKWLGWWMLLVSCAACLPAQAPLAAPPTPFPSLWGAITPLGAAPQAQAPALGLYEDGRWLSAWASADDREARLVAYSPAAPTPTILALKAYAPLAPLLLPAQDGRFHLLWLDRIADEPQLYLQTALVDAQAIAELGPNRAADTPIFAYAAVADVGGGVRVVWSGGSPAEPTLYTQTLDGRGRIRFPVLLTSDASWPALARLNGGALYVFWQTQRGQIMRAILEGDQLLNAHPLTTPPALRPGDRLERLSAAHDLTHGYLFWQIVRADGTPEVWLTAGAIEAGTWAAPQRWVVPGGATSGIQTGFNSGAVMVAVVGGTAPQWAQPLAGQYRMLPVVVQLGTMTGVAYLLEGRAWGYQHLARSGALLAAPFIAADRDNHLYVTWAEPDTQAGYSVLRLTTTRPPG